MSPFGICPQRRHHGLEGALLVGNVPARRIGWMCQCGERLPEADAEGAVACAACGSGYRQETAGELRAAALVPVQGAPT